MVTLHTMCFICLGWLRVGQTLEHLKSKSLQESNPSLWADLTPGTSGCNWFHITVDSLHHLSAQGGPGQPRRAGDRGRRARADGGAEAVLPRAEGAAHPVGVRRQAAQGVQGWILAGKEGEYRFDSKCRAFFKHRVVKLVCITLGYELHAWLERATLMLSDYSRG